MAEFQPQRPIDYWRIAWKTRPRSQFFSPYKAIPSVLVAAIQFLIKYHKTRTASFMDTWIACGVTLGIYLIISAIVSLWSTAVVAPVSMHNQQGKTIHQLSERLEFPDKALGEHLRELLGRVGSNGKRVIQFILWHGETMPSQVKITGMTDKEIHESLELCFSENLLDRRLENRGMLNSPLFGHFAGIYIYYFVPDELKGTLRLLLSDAKPS